jgi:hypothetical protein
LFLKKRRNVPYQFEFHGLAVIRRRYNDAVDQLPHELYGIPRGLATFRSAAWISATRRL